jgi:Regulated-SNARE-like domain
MFYIHRTNKMAIASDKMVFYYMARDNLCFLTLCEDAYPKRLAFLYLDDVADIILNELQREYGTNVSFFKISLRIVPLNDAIFVWKKKSQ